MSLTPEQQHIRKNGIGASEIAAVCGLNPWSSPHDVWERKTGRVEYGTPDNDSMLWGRFMEPAIVAMYKARTGRHVRYANRHQRTFVHPKHDICIATPDGLVDPDANLEVKTYGFRLAHHWGEPGTDNIPEYYTTQITWAMGATGRPRCIVLAAHDKQVDEYLVRYDDELFEALRETAQAFWHDYVFADQPPPPDHTNRCREFLQRYYPRSLDKAVADESPAANAAATRLWAAQTARKSAEREEAQAKHELMELIGDSYGVQTELGKVLWYGTKGRETIDTKAAIELIRQLGGTDEQVSSLKKRGADYRIFRAYFKETH